jgi:hypothetical protein
MPKGFHGGQFTEADSTVISVRVPHALAAAINEAAGTNNVADWARNLFKRATSYGTQLGAAMGPGFEHAEGWRAGWDAANRQFRAALTAVLAESPPEAPP